MVGAEFATEWKQILLTRWPVPSSMRTRNLEVVSKIRGIEQGAITTLHLANVSPSGVAA